jgi:hypothetical protein
VCQYSRGSVSLAYCSVNGMTGSIVKIDADNPDDHGTAGRSSERPQARG